VKSPVLSAIAYTMKSSGPGFRPTDAPAGRGPRTLSLPAGVFARVPRGPLRMVILVVVVTVLAVLTVIVALDPSRASTVPGPARQVIDQVGPKHVHIEPPTAKP
jgi:hypothetical protein